MNPSPSFLLCVVLYGLPNPRPDESKHQKKNGSYTFVKGLCKLKLVHLEQHSQHILKSSTGSEQWHEGLRGSFTGRTTFI